MPEENEIKKRGIYFSIYLYLFNLIDLIEEIKFPEFIIWFKQRAEKEYN